MNRHPISMVRSNLSLMLLLMFLLVEANARTEKHDSLAQYLFPNMKKSLNSSLKGISCV